jgi:hypothetical protein
VPEAMQQMRPFISKNTGSLQSPLQLTITNLFPCPLGGWSESALQLLSTLLRATAAELLPTAELATQPLELGTPLRELYCKELAPLLLSFACAAKRVAHPGCHAGGLRLWPAGGALGARGTQ